MASLTQTSDRDGMRAGHWWKEADRVREYVERNDKAAAEINEVFALLNSVLPFESAAPIRMLDIGSGHGVFAAAILDAFPNARATGLDISEAMMAEGRQRMARFGDRFAYHEGDFADGVLPTALTGPFDLVVSSRAIHHLVSEDKQRLYADILGHLNDGGCFFNFDNMRPHDDFLRRRYSQAPDATRPAASAEPRPAEPRAAGGREHPDPVEDQLGWLRAVGYHHVDVFWKRLGRSLIGGFKDN